MTVDERTEPSSAGRPQPEVTLLDRQAERAAIDRVLGGVREGFSGTLVLRGEPGVGKTTLLRYAIAAATDMRVSSITGVESEISLEFAGLHQLLLPFLPLVEELPLPQQSALRVAFGQEAGPPPERFLVALATLTLISLAAEDQPLLCTVDDAHWLDRESSQALAFVARRLYADRVAIIATSNMLVASSDGEGLPTLMVDGLPDAEARELLAAVAEGAFTTQTVDRILAETRNNPLALVELGRAYADDETGGPAAPLEPLPLGERLRGHFLRLVSGLPPDARKFTLLAAADPEGDRNHLWRAAAQAGIDPETAAAETAWAGVLEFSGSSFSFRYPLLRSAVYHGARPAHRRFAHRTLGETDDSELRSWHLAAAAIAPCEELAADLQRTAERAAARGGCATMAALLQRSVELTPEDSRRAEREIALAGAMLMAGDPVQAQAVRDAAEPRLASAPARRQARQLAGAIRFAQGDAAAAARMLASAAQEFTDDARLARDTMLAALEAAMWSGPPLTQEVARQARALPPAGGAPSVSDLLLEGLSARFTSGYQASVQPLRGAVTALLADDPEPEGLRWFALGYVAAGSLWDDRAVFALTDRWIKVAQAAGAFTALPVALGFRSVTDARAGRLSEAHATWASMLEVLSLSQGLGALGLSGQRNGLGLAIRGDLAGARMTALAVVHEAEDRGLGQPAEIGRYIAVLADLLAGDYPSAMSRALIVFGNDPAYTAEASLPELVESAYRAGEHEIASTVLETLSQRAAAAATPWGLGLRARCAALLADGAEAEDFYRESISQLARCEMAVDLARAHLLYGQWLRGAKRRRDARAELRTAHDMFAQMGAERLAGQAAAELRAAGEQARGCPPVSASGADLTPQEARIAGLTATGASNSEVAAELFISPSTVDYHLRKVFRKLNVTSRTQLASRLESGRATVSDSLR
jgi:DNA-binding CsgD family transcriptional regulator